MVEGFAVDARLGDAPVFRGVPTPRTAPDDGTHRHRAPTLAELIANAAATIERDALAPSGYLVTEVKGAARHQHAVWQLGPFALLDDGWFGTVQAWPGAGAATSRSLAKHERRCGDQHWTSFQWIDPAALDTGCGASGVGLGLSPHGPTYCRGFDPGEQHPTHLPLVEVFRDGLALLAARPGR